MRKLLAAFIALGSLWGGILTYKVQFAIHATQGLSQNLGAAIPTGVAFFQTSLLSGMGTADSTATLVSGTTKDGSSLSGFYGFTIDEGTSTQEVITCTASGTALTGCTRGISAVTGNTSVASLIFAHRRGASVKITTSPITLVLGRIANGDVSFPNLVYYNSALNFNTASSSVIVSKGYVDTTVLAGCANSDTTTKGCVEMATVAEINAGVPRLGTDTGAWLSVNPSYLASSNYGLNIPIAGQKAALAGSSGTPSASNLYITQNDVASASFSDAADKVIRSDGDSVPSALWLDLRKLTSPASASGDLIVRTSTAFARLASAGATAGVVNDGWVLTASNSANTEMYWHSPAPKTGTTTKATSDASTTQNIAHGLGRRPTYVRIKAIGAVGSANVAWDATTTYNGTTQSSISHYGSGTNGNNADNTFTLQGQDGGGNPYKEVGVVTWDGTNIIITWTGTGSAGAITYTLLWEAY